MEQKLSNSPSIESRFYCGKKLKSKVHVDHFIPWSFVKDDKIWNFVLSCPECNIRKNNRVPSIDYLEKIEYRNKKIQTVNNLIIQTIQKNLLAGCGLMQGEAKWGKCFNKNRTCEGAFYSVML